MKKIDKELDEFYIQVKQRCYILLEQLSPIIDQLVITEMKWETTPNKEDQGRINEYNAFKEVYLNIIKRLLKL
jgi:hypothetical protein